MSKLSIQIPEKLGFLFESYQYKILKGGRGSGKSWGIADATLVQGMQRPLRIGCYREVQKSIRDSVHKLLADKIMAHNLGDFYEIQSTTIKGRNGTEYIFGGLQDHTVQSVKSAEGIDIAWIEEGQAVSKKSLDVFLPTIRKPGSQVWVSYNPELETDPVHQKFVVTPPPGTFVQEMNWRDNPWFPAKLNELRLHDMATRPRWEYDHIWEGKCLPAVSGAIYAEEIARMEDEGRIRDVAYDPMLKVFPIFDLGWNDAISIILVQRDLSTLRVVEYLEDSHKTLDWWSAELKKKNLNWGKMYLPHDGANGDFKTGKSAKQILSDLGWDVDVLPRQPIATGIRQARMEFPKVYIDKTKGSRLIECLRRYRRHIPTTTGEAAAPVHDEYSHGADAFRYMAMIADQLTNEDTYRPLVFASEFA